MFQFFASCMTIMYRVWGLIIVMFFAHASPALGQSKPSAYDFVQFSAFEEVKLSPNGNFVAFFQRFTSQTCLDRYGQIVEEEKARCKDKDRAYRAKHVAQVYNLATRENEKTIPIPENYFVSWIEWASDDRFLMGIYRPTTVGESGRGYSLGGSRILSVPLDDKPITGLFTNEKRVAKNNRYLTRTTNLLRDDPDHIIMPANRRGELDLWKVNLNDGKAERIALGTSRTFYWFADNEGKPVMRFDCQRRCRRVAVYTPSEDGEDWKKIKTFKVKPDEDQEDFDFWPIASAPEDGQFYVVSDEDTDARKSIKIFDLEKEEFVKTVYEHPEYDVGGAVLALGTGEYAGAWYVDDRLQYDLLDKDLQKHVNAINTYFGNRQNVSLLGFNKEGNRAVVYANAPGNPGGYYLYDFNAQKIERLISRVPSLTGHLKAETDILKIKTRDGTELTAYHTYPEGQPSGAPLIVMPHGGPEVRDSYGYDSTVEYFAYRGYQVLQVNFRGSSGYGRAFAEAGYGEWGGVMQNDVTDVVKHFHDKGLAVPETTCIVGYSYGGYVALYGGAFTPELYKCIVAGGGVSDLLKDLRQTKKDYGSDSEAYEYWTRSIGDPKTDKDKLQSASPVYFAKNFVAPVMLVHGEYDGTVDIGQSRKMRKALEKAGKTVTFIELEDEGHSGWDMETEILYLETVESFLREHIGP